MYLRVIRLRKVAYLFIVPVFLFGGLNFEDIFNLLTVTMRYLLAVKVTCVDYAYFVITPPTTHKLYCSYSKNIESCVLYTWRGVVVLIHSQRFTRCANL